jgi:hypothetical protein
MPAQKVFKAPPPAQAERAEPRRPYDSWELAAVNGSEALLRALRRHHPERCGGK